jgi:hypothetical protein
MRKKMLEDVFRCLVPAMILAELEYEMLDISWFYPLMVLLNYPLLAVGWFVHDVQAYESDWRKYQKFQREINGVTVHRKPGEFWPGFARWRHELSGPTSPE